MGGGGGGGGDEARQMEAERQERIRAATDEINAIFNNKVKKTTLVQEPGYARFGGLNMEFPAQYETTWEDGDPANSRDKMYADQRSAMYDLNKTEVDRQAAEAERTNRFGLARTGLAGGSADIDAASELNRRTNEGLMRAGGIADQSAADMRLADERTRSSLISMAQSGIDTGTAATMALNGLKSNAESATAQRAGSSVGSLFDDLSQAYLANQVNAGRTSAINRYGSGYSSLNPRTGSSGTVQ